MSQINKVTRICYHKVLYKPWLAVGAFIFVFLFFFALLMREKDIVHEHDNSSPGIKTEFQMDLEVSAPLRKFLNTSSPTKMENYFKLEEFLNGTRKSLSNKLDPDIVETLNSLDPLDTTIGLVLQVYKRQSLAYQLDCARNQTLTPKTIIVFQNGYYVDVREIIQKFRKENPDIEVQHIASSKNQRFHGRFFIAYTMQEDYVSIWDDDIEAHSDWLWYCVMCSKLKGHALIGRAGLTLQELEIPRVKDAILVGLVDFVGHTWTLPRVLLKYYIEMKPVTLHTGEDIQIAFALQKVGIDCYVPPQNGSRLATTIVEFHIDKTAHFRWQRAPRYLLFCKLLKKGFRTLQCKNCHDQQVLNKCIDYFSKNATAEEMKAIADDKIENNKVVWAGKGS